MWTIEFEEFALTEAVIREHAEAQFRALIAEIVGDADADRVKLALVSSDSSGGSYRIEAPADLAKRIAESLTQR